MSILSDVPNAVVDTIKTGLPDLRSCHVMEGRFDEGELGRVGTSTPAVLVARLGAVQNYPNPEWQILGYRVKMAAFVVTSTRLGATASDHLDAIATYILGLLPDQMWGLDDAGPAEKISEQPVVTSITRSKKVLISAITWEQPVALAAPVPGVAMDIDLYVRQGDGAFEEIGAGA